MNTKTKIMGATATIALALVIAPKPSTFDPSLIERPALTCYSNESACDLINPTNDVVRYDPCVTEDQTTPCYWDATTRGNGQGQSFIVTTSGKVVYVP